MNQRNQKRMQNQKGLPGKKRYYVTVFFLAAFVLWTVGVCCIDVQAIGPKGTSVGFATLNGLFHNLTGVHMTLYTITDWLGLVPIFCVLGFAMLGLIQLIKRKSLLKVDADILVLGIYYVVVIGAYILFEVVVINYRPILIEGRLEASYPSSTTLLVMCVMASVMIQLYKRIQSDVIRNILMVLVALFSAFMVIGRLISGVHWLSDIIAAVLLSNALIMAYHTICEVCKGKE